MRAFVCVYLTFIPQKFIIDTCSVENITQVLELERKKKNQTGSVSLDSFSYSLIERTLADRSWGCLGTSWMCGFACLCILLGLSEQVPILLASSHGDLQRHF